MATIKIEPLAMEDQDLMNLDVDERNEYDFDLLDDNKETKCGDVIVTGIGKFIFCCYFCTERFDKTEEFTGHVYDLHCKLLYQDADMLDMTAEVIEDFNEEYLAYSSDEVEDFHDSVENDDENSTQSFKEVISVVSKSPMKKEKATIKRSKKKPKFVESKDDPTCEKCKRKFLTRSGYLQHLKSHDNVDKIEVERPFCDICNEYFETSEDYDMHKCGVHEPSPEEHPLTCRFCSKTFVNKSHLVIHENRHSNHRPFECWVCGKRFFRRTELVDHTLTHSGNRRHKCTHCDLTFAIRPNLAAHIKRAHLMQRPYKCDFCEKVFATNSEKKIHHRSHTAEKPYQCDKCGNNFTTSSSMNNHRRKHGNIKPYCCDVCGKSFFMLEYLKNHLRIHTDDKPYECEECPRTFRTRQSLKAHIKIHSGTKAYVCHICDKAFTQHSGLYAHQKCHGDVIIKKLEVVPQIPSTSI